LCSAKSTARQQLPLCPVKTDAAARYRERHVCCSEQVRLTRDKIRLAGIETVGIERVVSENDLS
jgi:hypothetical protein